VRAVCGVITVMPAGWGVVRTEPSAEVIDCTIRGGMRTPLLAIVW